jgi:hypothetical protein
VFLLYRGTAQLSHSNELLHCPNQQKLQFPKSKEILYHFLNNQLLIIYFALQLRDGQVILADPPNVDQVYTSTGNVILIESHLLHYGNTFDCKWKMLAPVTTTTTPRRDDY